MRPSSTRLCGKGPHAHRGFALLALLIVLAVLGLAASQIVMVDRAMQRRHAEAQLMRAGLAYRRAIASYVSATPAGAYPYPHQLTDLLRDPRYPTVKRHLRELYPDPVARGESWGLVAAPGGGIAGVFSASLDAPIKLADFPAGLEFFETAESYRDWVFSVLAPADSKTRSEGGARFEREIIKIDGR